MQVFGTISGTIGVHTGITGSLSPPATLTGSLIYSAGGVPAEPYEGDYEVTPRVYAQSLDTDGKLMMDDVTVYEIPVTRTTNPQGGLTVLIG